MGVFVFDFPPSSPPDVLLPVLRGEAEVLVEAVADVVAVKSVGGDAWEIK